MSISNRLVFSGIQPTGVPHLGNYVGALMQWKNLLSSSPSPINSSESKIFFSVVDLHAISNPSAVDGEHLDDLVLQTAASVMAVLDDDDNKDQDSEASAVLFIQSQVPQHTELAWYFSSCATLGELQRMTQWKSKSSTNPNANCALFTYPILQAADIALYNANVVPVGSDQLQHLELSRNIISRFNRRFGTAIELPSAYTGSHPRIMSLRNPQMKMSKSDSNSMSRIALTDSPDDIARKIRKAVTDTEGIKNLLSIMAALTQRSVEDVAQEFSTCSNSVLKEECTRIIINHFEPIRNRYQSLIDTPNGRSRLLDRLKRGQTAAQIVANENMRQIRSRMKMFQL